MKLHQLRLDYVAEHDRLLLRISTDDAKEVLLWLTRRCVRLLWPLLVDMAQSSPRIALQGSPEARAALLGFEHEQALRGADFSRLRRPRANGRSGPRCWSCGYKRQDRKVTTCCRRRPGEGRQRDAG
jgi:hypothetical protein